MTKKTLSRCLTTIGMLAFAISMALPAAALEDSLLHFNYFVSTIAFIICI